MILGFMGHGQRRSAKLFQEFQPRGECNWWYFLRNLPKMHVLELYTRADAIKRKVKGSEEIKKEKESKVNNQRI